MGTRAADGSRGARRWLSWLGLCFWAAGAAAARGKRWVDGGAWRGADGGGAGLSPSAWASQVVLGSLRAQSPTRWEPRRGALGDHCLSTQVCYLQ